MEALGPGQREDGWHHRGAGGGYRPDHQEQEVGPRQQGAPNPLRLAWRVSTIVLRRLAPASLLCTLPYPAHSLPLPPLQPAKMFNKATLTRDFNRVAKSIKKQVGDSGYRADLTSGERETH